MAHFPLRMYNESDQMNKEEQNNEHPDLRDF